MSDRLERAVVEREENAKAGVRTLTLWAGNLKDELRANAKVDTKKTRYIASGPVDYVIVFRKYFQHMVATAQAKCIRGTLSMGLDPHGPMWGAVFNWLTELALDGIAGDFTNFDGSIPAKIWPTIERMVNTWYSGVGAAERHVLLQELHNAHHIVMRWVLVTVGCNPSGAPGTSFIDTLVLYCVLMSSLCVLLAKDGHEPRGGLALARLIGYGDDNCLTHPLKLDWAALPRIVKHFYGMTLTPTTKIGELVAQRMIDTTYLSRGWVYEGGVLQAPLALSRIREILYWVRDRERTTLVNTLNSFCLELTHHGREVYNSHRRILSAHPYLRLQQVDIPTFEKAYGSRFGIRMSSLSDEEIEQFRLL
jgi:hypothetical protein